MDYKYRSTLDLLSFFQPETPLFFQKRNAGNGSCIKEASGLGFHKVDKAHCHGDENKGSELNACGNSIFSWCADLAAKWRSTGHPLHDRAKRVKCAQKYQRGTGVVTDINVKRLQA